MDQTQTRRYVPRFEPLALRPRLHREGFLIHQEYRTPLSTNNLHRGNTNTIHLYRRGIQAKPNSTSPRGSKPTISTSTKEGATNKGFLQQVVYLNHKPLSFSHKTNDPIEQDRVIQLKWKSRCFWKSNNKEKLLEKSLVNDRNENPKQYPKNLVFFEFFPKPLKTKQK